MALDTRLCDRSSWIRRWFARQDDFLLWAMFAVFVLASINLALAIITFVLELIVRVAV